MKGPGNYDKLPFTPAGPAARCDVGWPAILERLRPLAARERCVLAVECYPGVDQELPGPRAHHDARDANRRILLHRSGEHGFHHMLDY